VPPTPSTPNVAQQVGSIADRGEIARNSFDRAFAFGGLGISPGTNGIILKKR
jgi:hypothetical protein